MISFKMQQQTDVLQLSKF